MKYKQITAAERGVIESLLRKHYTLSSIASELKRSKSSVSRELSKYSKNEIYSAEYAHDTHTAARINSRKHKKLSNTYVKNIIFDKLQSGYSPQQISGRLKLENIRFYVSSETIYSDPLCIDDKWHEYLRYGRKKRKLFNGRSKRKSKIPNRISIHNRPDIVSKKLELVTGKVTL